MAKTRAVHLDKKRAWNANCVQTQFGGDDRDRTDDLLNAIQTRSQLRYAPKSNDTIIISGESCFVNLFLILFSMKFLRVDKVKKEFIMILF